MNELLIALCVAMAAAPLNAATAPSPASSRAKAAPGKGAPARETPAPAPPVDAVEAEYQSLLEKDDAAQEEAEAIAKQVSERVAAGETFADTTLAARISQRLDPVQKQYEEFILRHPKHVRGRIAFGSFLSERGDELGAKAQWETARDLDPKNPVVWNNLANYHGHRGPVVKAFEFYEKAIELNPLEPLYYHNFGTTVFLFRKDAVEYFKTDEQGVFNRALALYDKALKLSPKDYPLALDIAQTYYGIRPPRTEDAIKAFNYALSIASDDVQREGAYLHLARVWISAGQFERARTNLALVRHEGYADLKRRVEKSLKERESRAQGKSGEEPSKSPGD